MTVEPRGECQPLDLDETPSAPSPTTHFTEIVETVLTGLILAFIFRAFFVEPFIIPTGSMADTLLGAHATCVCPACGWEFDFAPVRATPVGAPFLVPPEVVCPNCQLRIDTSDEHTVPKAGDRILVHKWPYLLGGPFRPRRWDVIVFRDPANPEQHYIKRLVGLPGETVELLDGDVFINGRIARKPPEVQRALWFVVFDQSHAPDAADPSGVWTRWVTNDAPPDQGAGWSGMDTRVISYNGLDQTPRTLTFMTGGDRDYLRDFYAYDRRSSGTPVHDVRVIADVTFQGGAGLCRWELVLATGLLAAEVHRDGMVQLTVTDEQVGGRVVRLTAPPRAAFAAQRPATVEFGHVDYRAYLAIDGQEVLTTTDAEYAPQIDVLRAAAATNPPTIRLVATNVRLELRRLRIDRDVCYTCHPELGQRACAGAPFALHAREYFVLGDNSPDSHDSREWEEHGPNLPADYRLGTVREDQIVGLAAFVYLPGLLPLDAAGRWRVPDVGRARFVR
jgi:signal peptidase I